MYFMLCNKSSIVIFTCTCTKKKSMVLHDSHYVQYNLDSHIWERDGENNLHGNMINDIITQMIFAGIANDIQNRPP